MKAVEYGTVGVVVSSIAAELLFAGHGLDLMDEAYYLAAMADPGRFPGSVSQFGFVYHPLHALLDGNVAWLRRTNVLVTALLTGLAAHQVLRARTALPAASRHALTAATAGLGLLTLVLGWQTPSYNSLCAQAVAICVWGLARSDIAGDIILGIGLWTAALAKPPAAVALAALVGVFLLVVGLLTVRRIVVTGLAGLVAALTSSYLIAGGPHGLITRMQAGAAEYRLSGHHAWHAILRLELPHPEPAHWAAAILVVALLASAWTRTRLGRFGVVGSGVLLLVLCIPRAYVIDAQQDGRVVIALAAIVAALAIGRVRGRAESAWLLLLLLLPIASAVGSAWPILFIAGTLVCWWWLAAVLTLAATPNHTRERVAVFGLVGATLGAAFLAGPFLLPFNQPGPLWRAQTPTTINGHALRVDHSEAAVLTRMRRAGSRLAPASGLIDLTGVSPGASLVMHRPPIDQVWVINQGDGAGRVEADALRRQPCRTLARAAVLVGRGGVTPLNPSVLHTFGADLGDYRSVGAWKPFPLSDGLLNQRFTPLRAQTLSLLKPTRSPAAAEAACVRVRTGAD